MRLTIKNLCVLLCIFGLISNLNAKEYSGLIQRSYCTMANSSDFNNPNRAGGIDLLYVNGIANSPEDAEESRINILGKISNRLLQSYPMGIRVGNIYNPAGGMKSYYDLLELRDQAQAEAEATRRTNDRINELKKLHPDWDASIVERLRVSFFNRDLKNVYTEQFLQAKQWNQVAQDGSVQDATGDGSGSEFIGPIILKIVAAIEERLLSGRRVVVIAHSQGNHFMEAAYALLLHRLSPTQMAGLQVVGVAVVSSTSPNNRWITIAQDKAVYVWNVRNGGAPIGLSNVPPGNFDAVAKNAADSNSSYNEENIYSWDSNGHNFISIYLNDEIALRDNHSLSVLEKLRNTIKEAIDTTVAPNSIFSLGVFSATLVWINNVDIDLHVVEKFNDNTEDTHVFYGRKNGRLGYLDIDDTDGQGPEHYYTDTFSNLNLSGNVCDNLSGKTLEISINPYGNLNVDEPVALNIRVGATLFSRSVLIKNFDRGNYGRKIYTVKFNENGSYTVADDL